jgi:hypothetical protein
VTITFEKCPLERALSELAAATGINVVLDARIPEEKSQKEVGAVLTEVPVDAATRVLANMADLTVVPIDNILYVTTRDNATVFQAELR